ncbi:MULTISPECIES: Mo-dependent nitrogenase C-terminal domain-containing protein [unclassified Cyanobium]|uniref:Mo-dependent nitrogenase C-terminal domain-containing protein n=1 Tax=unclassified Cyanobium TaxID=2627006 RepID=UPI0020CC0611|nr:MULTISPECIES: Mo-dependent nitrogenase C-terminal domain-containing protein [unclassified Cyanobium]MCP9832770.1 Mo-dependent nitrogenase [Cyanobium sp. La Preciosa 7G6]MCP9935521.1 Mo-dependent nitrogenase [Cyanobium sp. Aljojuca 7A6]
MVQPVAIDGLDATAARRRLWLAALHQLALADGDFSPAEERLLAEQLTNDLPGLSLDDLHHPGDEALVHRFGVGTPTAEEFLRSAVLVALADGHLSAIECERLRHWSELLQVGQTLIEDLLKTPTSRDDSSDVRCDTHQHPGHLDALRHWMDDLDPSDPEVARFLVRLIPAQCPFERDVKLFGWKLVHIPPMCKINPLFDQLMALRFRCLCRLEEGGEDSHHPCEQSPAAGARVTVFLPASLEA